MPAEDEAPAAEEPQTPKDLEGKKPQKDLYMPAERLSRDNQLMRALDLLKAWQVFESVAGKKTALTSKAAGE